MQEPELLQGCGWGRGAEEEEGGGGYAVRTGKPITHSRREGGHSELFDETDKCWERRGRRERDEEVCGSK